MSDIHFLPDVPEVDVTPELVCRILDQLPQHEEGDFSFTLSTDKLAALIRATGKQVVIGYQNWGSNAEERGAGDGNES